MLGPRHRPGRHAARTAAATDGTVRAVVGQVVRAATRRAVGAATAGGAVLLALGVTGCGSASPAELPPPAAPRASPPLQERPEGEVVRVGGTPTGVVVDGATGLAAIPRRTGRAADLLLVRAEDGRPVRRTPLPAGCRPGRPTLAGARGPVLVPCRGIDRLVQLALPTGRVLSVAPTGSGPRVAVATAPAGRVLVSDGDGASLSVIDRGRTTGRFATDLQPGGLVAVDGGRRVGVVARRARTLQVLDARTGARGERIPFGVGPGDAIAARSARVLWAPDTGGGGVLVGRIDPEPKVRRRVYVPLGPDAMAHDRARERLWVTVPGRNVVARVGATERPGAQGERPIVRDATGVGVDPFDGRVLVTGARGELQLLDPDGSRAGDPVGPGTTGGGGPADGGPGRGSR